MPDDDRQHEGNLSRRIEELEALLAKQQAQDAAREARPANIPILDEVVNPEDYPDLEPEPAPQQPSQEEIKQLVAMLEEKFSRELDETVGMLKDNLRANIAEELRAQLRQDSNSRSKADIDTSEE